MKKKILFSISLILIIIIGFNIYLLTQENTNKNKKDIKDRSNLKELKEASFLKIFNTKLFYNPEKKRIERVRSFKFPLNSILSKIKEKIKDNNKIQKIKEGYAEGLCFVFETKIIVISQWKSKEYAKEFLNIEKIFLNYKNPETTFIVKKHVNKRNITIFISQEDNFVLEGDFFDGNYKEKDIKELINTIWKKILEFNLKK